MPLALASPLLSSMQSLDDALPSSAWVLACRELYSLLLSWNGTIGLWQRTNHSGAFSGSRTTPLVIGWEPNGVAVRICNAALHVISFVAQ
jgi:hypothetical protein